MVQIDRNEIDKDFIKNTLNTDIVIAFGETKDGKRKRLDFNPWNREFFIFVADENVYVSYFITATAERYNSL